MRKLKVTLIKSPIGFAEVQKRTARALGLGKLHKTVELPDNPQIRGMVRAIRHLVHVTAVDGQSIRTGEEEQSHASA